MFFFQILFPYRLLKVLSIVPCAVHQTLTGYLFYIQYNSACMLSCSAVSDFLQPPGLQLLCPWNFPGKNTRVGCHFLLQGILPTQGSNPCLFHCWEPTHETLPMTRSRGESLTGKADQVFRDFEKLPPALTLKMISVFLMSASMDYSLISVTRQKAFPDLFPNKNQFRTLINKFPRWWYFMRLSRVKGVF